MAPRATLAVENRLLLPDLTAKQAQALLAAHDAGYYSVPRRATTAQVSRTARLSPSTFKEHLQRAEGQVVAAMLPFLRLRAQGDAKADGVETFAAYHRGLAVWVVLHLRKGRIQAVRLEARKPKGARPRHPFLIRILAHLRDGEDLGDLPFDLAGGGFHAQVQQALRDIPPGTTITYSDLAARLGHPGAARAVGNACAGNPLLLVLPCHRVVPAGGGVGQYAGHGGPATKRRLLAAEAERARSDVSRAPARGTSRAGSAARRP